MLGRDGRDGNSHLIKTWRKLNKVSAGTSSSSLNSLTRCIIAKLCAEQLPY
jgi:hypothetical protein